MKISRKWLSRYIDISDITDEQIIATLPMLGLEVEAYEKTGMMQFENVVVGEILSRDQHPNADKLGVCQVKIDENKDPIIIVCGASNYKVSDRVPVALIGAKLPDGDKGFFEIKKSALRGVESNGMMCSGRELAISSDHSGLLILEDRPLIGTPINEAIKIDNDSVFELELTANRGDCLSHIGVARELACAFNKKLILPENKLDISFEDNADVCVELNNTNCPYYTAIKIKDVQIKESPSWLKRDLESVGLRPINNVVDVTNFVLMEYGQPLHAFDASKVLNEKIIIRSALENEKIKTLDDKEYSLKSSAMLVCDEEKPLAIAGIMGGENSQVTCQTTDIILETAYFNPENVRATSRALNISSDSSYRFSRDVDPQIIINVAKRACVLIAELTGGKISEKATLKGKSPRTDTIIDLDPSFIVKKAGFDIEYSQIEKIFLQLGFLVDKQSENLWKVTVGSFRSEVTRPVDLLEEFIRVYGTDKIPTNEDLSFKVLSRQDDSIFTFNNKASEYLRANGFCECQNYTLCSADREKNYFENAEKLKLENPLTSDQDSLRSSLIPSLIDTLKLNINDGNFVNGLFEYGKVFRFINEKLWEFSSVAFVFEESNDKRTWLNRQKPDFFTAKNFIQNIAQFAKVSKDRIELSPYENDKYWQNGHAGYCTMPKVSNWSVSVGALNLKMLKNEGLKKVVYAGEFIIKPETLVYKNNASKFEKFSPYPASLKDISLIVESSMSAQSVLKEVKSIAKSASDKIIFAQNVEIFDVYEGKSMQEGKKSIALCITFKSNEGTLTDAQITKAFDTILSKLQANPKFDLRKQ